jgi:hypothetical protein
MVWWALLAYLLLSPVLGLIIGTGIRMQGSGTEGEPVEAPCPRAAPDQPALAMSGG